MHAEGACAGRVMRTSWQSAIAPYRRKIADMAGVAALRDAGSLRDDVARFNRTGTKLHGDGLRAQGSMKGLNNGSHGAIRRRAGTAQILSRSPRPHE